MHFLALLLEERGAGDLAAVAEHCRTKLIRRHPHVFGDVQADDAATVLRNWDAIKRDEPGREEGVFADVPETLPSPLYARKLLRRAGSAGREWPEEGALERLRREVGRAAEASAGGDEGDARGGEARRERFEVIGDVLLAAVALARELRVDPELALRASAGRFRARVEEGSAA